MAEVRIQTGARQEMVDITREVAAAVEASDCPDGICHVFLPHTTAGLTLNENWDEAVRRDMLDMLERLVPSDTPCRHAEGNSPAHLKASLVGFGVFVPLRGGKLALGNWQGIYLCEFDGPRTRRVLVDVVRSG